jgi:hypothetical protein
MKALAPIKSYDNNKRFSKVGQTPRSKVRGSRSWYQLEGLVIRNKHVKCESPPTNQSKVMSKVNIFEN